MESHIPRQALVQEKTELEQSVLDMGARADTLLGRAEEALSTLNITLAHEAMESDDEIDEIEVQVEQRCLRVLALQQPMGEDLREVGTVLKIITDIERIGDLGVEISKIALKVDAEMGTSSFVDIRPMMELARKMVRESIQFFVKKDTAILPLVKTLEDHVDQIYRDLRGQVHDYMRENPDQVVAASWMVLAIHHIERVADHALNIAERVNFMVTGEFRKAHGGDEPELGLSSE